MARTVKQKGRRGKWWLKVIKRSLVGLLTLTIILFVTIFFYMKQAKFGKLASGQRLERMKQSPNYRNGKFFNQVERPLLSEGYTMVGELYKTLFKKFERREPTDSLPTVHTNLKQLNADSNLAVWFGHSSVLLQLDGKKILIDPVFSSNASPIPGSVKAFRGTGVYKADDMPDIDYLVISHDHYDHLDYETMLAIRHKVKYVVCGLGVGAHLELWGYTPEQIIEKDWYEQVAIDSSLVIHTMPAHHDGGRGLKRSQSLWLSFVIETPGMKIYYSGDGGYDPVFKEVGEKFGTIDLALMECGQYNVAWQSVHKLPEEVMQATLDVNALRMLPVHHSKFRLANHSWDDPLVKISALSAGKPYHLATPMIGEVIDLSNPQQTFRQWWLGLR